MVTKKRGYCIYIDTVIDGPVPLEHDATGRAIVYATREEAERSIAEDVIDALQQFLDGERDFDDAMTVEQYVVEVEVQKSAELWGQRSRGVRRQNNN